MQPLTRQDLYSLERYAVLRPDFRRRVLEHKKPRRVSVGPFVTLYFEDRLTMLYQVQEMLRVERIFEAEGIQGELDAYNPLIPDGDNLKATMMIEIGDPAERRRWLTRLVGIEQAAWLQAEGFDRIAPVCDEDLERTGADKTSAVHFLRFTFLPEQILALKQGAGLALGIDFPLYRHAVAPLPEATRRALLADFD